MTQPAQETSTDVVSPSRLLFLLGLVTVGLACACLFLGLEKR